MVPKISFWNYSLGSELVFQLLFTWWHLEGNGANSSPDKQHHHPTPHSYLTLAPKTCWSLLLQLFVIVGCETLSLRRSARTLGIVFYFIFCIFFIWGLSRCVRWLLVSKRMIGWKEFPILLLGSLGYRCFWRKSIFRKILWTWF